VKVDKIMKRSWQVRAAAAVIFVLGFAAGALALNTYRAWSRAEAQPTQQDRFKALSQRLQLSAEQQTQVRQVFDETRSQLDALRKESEPRVQEIRRQADERLRQPLTPEQWQQFQQMRDEMRQHGRRGRGGDEGRSPATDR
jgi:Spy/CpxP family protein refolding chaperone